MRALGVVRLPARRRFVEFVFEAIFFFYSRRVVVVGRTSDVDEVDAGGPVLLGWRGLPGAAGTRRRGCLRAWRGCGR